MRGGQRRRGVSILELMICLVIFSGVIITFAAVFPAGFQLTGQGLAVNKAGTLANSVMEEIKGLSFSDAGFTGTAALGPGKSSNFTVCYLAPQNGQAGWGASATATNPGTPTTYQDTSDPNVPSTVFPHTVITVGDPQKVAGLNGDAGTFFLPLPGDNLTDNNGNKLVGIAVAISGMPLADPSPTPFLMGTGIASGNASLLATIRVTVAYREEVAGHGGAGKSTVLKSVTITSQLAQNLATAVH